MMRDDFDDNKITILDEMRDYTNIRYMSATRQTIKLNYDESCYYVVFTKEQAIELRNGLMKLIDDMPDNPYAEGE